MNGRLPKYLLIPFLLIVLILIGEGVYFFHLKEKTPSSTALSVQESHDETELNKYFDGVKFYEETGGEKKLIVVGGMISQVDDSKVVISGGGEDYSLLFDEIVGIKKFVSRDEEGEPIFGDLKYENLSVGMVVSFSPESGYLTVN